MRVGDKITYEGKEAIVMSSYILDEEPRVVLAVKDSTAKGGWKYVAKEATVESS